MRTFLLAAVACGAISAGHVLTPGTAADPGKPESVAAAPVPLPPPPPPRLIAHEWGTFTSFSGSDGVPVGFTPNNDDLPQFVYFQGNALSKSNRLRANGLVSMETPVIYFYTDKETRVSVKVDFPKGWITEWYPHASAAPAPQLGKGGGQSIRWDVKLTPGESVKFPRDRNNRENHYYAARETDAAPLQVEIAKRGEDDDFDDSGLRGGSVVQREKFLFYRGVGTFPPPVTVRALGGDEVRVVNNSGGRTTGLVLVTVRDGPYVAATTPFDPHAIRRILASRGARLATLGYLGHMWELYAMWTWVAVFASASLAASGLANAGAAGSLAAFLAIGSGAAGCALAGYLADRIGKARVAMWAMLASAVCAALTLLVYGGPPVLLYALVMVWGFAVVADSAQFSALVSEHAPSDHIGTALTLQTCVGFLLTMVTIEALPRLEINQE